MHKLLKTLVALLCAATLTQAAATTERPLHFGLSAAGSYIGIWHLNDEVFVKKETYVNDEGENTYREQSLTGGHDLHGFGGSFGVSGLWDFARNFQLHLDLYLSLRDRYVSAKEHHKKIITHEDGSVTNDRGSKGTYDITLTYWHIDFPVSVRYNLPSDFFIDAGVFASYIISANLKIKVISLDFQSYAAGMEFGTVGGFGKTFDITDTKRLEVFSRFIFGLTPLLNDRVKKYLYDRIRPREWLIQAGATFYLF